MAGLDKDHIKNIDKEAMSGFNKGHFQKMDKEAMAGFSRVQLSNVAFEAIGGFTKDHLSNLGEKAVSDLKTEHLENLNPDALKGLSGGHMKNLNPTSMKGFTRKQMKGISDDTLSNINLEQIRNLKEDSKKGLGDSVTSFEKFDVSVKKELVKEDVRLLGGVGSFADFIRNRMEPASVNIDKESESGWDSGILDKVKNASADKASIDSEITEIRGAFGGDKGKTNVLKKEASSRMKAKFGKLKIFKTDE